MYRGTTPQIKLTLDTTLDLTDIVSLYVTFKSFAIEITKTLEDVSIDNEKKEIRVALSQEETLKLKRGAVQVQVRFRMDDDLAYATSIAKLSLDDVLKEGVI